MIVKNVFMCLILYLNYVYLSIFFKDEMVLFFVLNNKNKWMNYKEWGK